MQIEKTILTVKKKPPATPAPAAPSDPVEAPAQRRQFVGGWNYETPIEGPISVSGYQFMRDTRGLVVARCAKCWLGFTGLDWRTATPRLHTHSATHGEQANDQHGRI